MDESRLDTSKTFTAQLSLVQGDIDRPVRINDSGWLEILDGHILPTTLWFGCYRDDGQDVYIIKEFTKGGSKHGAVLSMNSNGYLGFYSDSQRPWVILNQDDSALTPIGTPNALVSISTKGGRRWTATDNDFRALTGNGSTLRLKIQRIGVYHF
ncbi:MULTISPECIES: hypothetical protein [Pseudomonas]|uniref:hypothetical protein n=1 Tax=Pseudomonas TaxID=286 RepID=UPI00129BB33C|nr:MULTISPECIES: hypothetical protein [Pseudomonas]MBH3459734.1 hypothetical protein [Pseudomonas putida]